MTFIVIDNQQVVNDCLCPTVILCTEERAVSAPCPYLEDRLLIRNQQVAGSNPAGGSNKPIQVASLWPTGLVGQFFSVSGVRLTSVPARAVAVGFHWCSEFLADLG